MMINISTDNYNQNKTEITLQNSNGMIVKLLNHGATLEKILLPSKNGDSRNVILSLNSPSDYDKERNYLGGTVGRVIGRMKDGIWQKANGENMQFELNEDNRTHAHGGTYGLDTQTFEYQTEKTEDTCSVIFTYLDSDGHNGYPGNLNVTVKYTLDNTNKLTYSVSATTDKTTLCNIANHTYFCLDGPNTNVKDTTLKIPADTYLTLDEQHIPLKNTAPVENTCFDFKNGAPIAQALDSSDQQIQQENGLNHPFIINNKEAVSLESSDKKVKMTMHTNAPAVVTYTGNHFNHTGYAKNLGQYCGIALEAQIPPSATHDLSSIVLTPADTFHREVTWGFDYNL
ncbi:aldose epimerase family protein [Companilactobacillus huachuanensis]|uniref:Maltose epimerase n=1 Tax=Companilactobacillus huachuanensis TaxID=2559914 RepID=A0ABW1RJ77_9LACO|nr:aldose epimerase family protein [Companilactobacillus huachuanensis]